MDPVELRTNIWEDLFQQKASKSISQLAAEMNCEAEDVRAAVTCDWFNLVGSSVSIAYTTPGAKANR